MNCSLTLNVQMMKKLIDLINLFKLFLKWKNTPYSDMVQIHELTIMAARRCAYDLNHASQEIFRFTYLHGEKSIIDYEARARHWLNIFSPTGGKDYRHRLHTQISELEFKVEKLKKLLKENNIPFEEDIPF